MTDYPKDFYDDLEDTAGPSAQRIAPLVRALMPVRSVIDVGCGTGAWLGAFAGAGAGDVLGLDGDWVREEQLLIGPGNFQRCDLAKALPVERRFDLAISLEVAEHLGEEIAGRFVGELTRLAPVVLFSAAIPGQGGLHHVNEQPPDYWTRLFAEHGLRVIDTIRWQVWADPSVAWWYKQNILLFAGEDALEANSRLKAARRATPADAPIHIVHPERYAAIVARSRPGLGGWLKMGPRALARALSRRGSEADTR
ncbi:MAG: methyltransferase domain-containing protein [Alphaproteobacteria bacterium]